MSDREAGTAERLIALAVKLETYGAFTATERGELARTIRALSGLPAEVERLRELVRKYMEEYCPMLRNEASRLRAEMAEARDVIREARKQIAVAPRSLAYDLTLLPKLDAALSKEQQT